MKLMTSPAVEPADLLDLKLLPAWVKEPGEARNYERYTGAEESRGQKAAQGPPRGKPKRRTFNIQHPTPKPERREREGWRKKKGGSDRRSRVAKDRPSPNRHVPATQTPL